MMLDRNAIFSIDRTEGIHSLIESAYRFQTEVGNSKETSSIVSQMRSEKSSLPAGFNPGLELIDEAQYRVEPEKKDIGRNDLSGVENQAAKMLGQIQMQETREEAERRAMQEAEKAYAQVVQNLLRAAAASQFGYAYATYLFR